MKALTLDRVSKAFGDNLVVQDVSLRVEPGELFTLLGPSGCGKTTLLRMVAGFYYPTRGRILFGDRDLTTVPPHRRGVGMVFQNYALFPHMTVFENVAFGLRLRRVPRDELARRVRRALAQVQLEGYEGRRIDQLSGGQQQRVALARALVIQPDLLLLDEPLSNLDAKLREDTRSEIRRLQLSAGITTLYVTHDQAEAMAMSDRIAVLNQGRVLQVGTPEAIYHRPASRFVAGFIGKSNLVDATVVQRRADGAVQVRAGDVLLWCEAGRSNPGVPVDEGRIVTLCIRPEAFQPAAAGAANVLRGRVLVAEYAGSHTRYRLEAGGLEWLVDLPAGSGAAVRPGGELEVAVAPAQIFIVEAAGAQAGGAPAA
ncbi:ABC transporter ATP-binding protein [Thermaerobacter subterraneus]|uniref:ABC-type quaternary amine transporter n=1 Tax=Thermaerobacter subterraneus DSM 13965 TaxID=867903 RepID=K6PZS6_9FIRM|nr:ABC transporter ATP-binding protein [Thermaerobacter subterraneus]EKP94099.1 ABC-type spermidine/putrescine transport system, ATPase component [Thermaerobacter subterraneus DSM 13965]